MRISAALPSGALGRPAPAGLFTVATTVFAAAAAPSKTAAPAERVTA
ncbi:MAG: hypothetical protein HOZ81_36760 [Streptomyces sp.]|nr:hypothetical protein [Streptomyces sp.]NUT25856.1 hypothetical protein [Streptomyces sp.]